MEIAIGVVGGVVLLAVGIGYLGYYCYKKSRQSSLPPPDQGPGRGPGTLTVGHFPIPGGHAVGMAQTFESPDGKHFRQRFAGRAIRILDDDTEESISICVQNSAEYF